MYDSSFSISDGLALLKRNLFLLVAWLSVGACAGVILTYQLPKEYRSKAVLSIQGNYFQNPMSQDLIAALSDPREVLSQKMAILRMALSNDFVDGLAERHALYQFPSDDPRRARERELFMEKLSLYSTSPTTFQIEVAAETQALAHTLSSAVLDRMLEVLFESRYRTLFSTRDVIDSHVKTLNQALRDNPVSAIETKSAEALRDELSKLDANVAALLVKFTERHPAVVDLRRKQQALINILSKTDPQSEGGAARKGREPLSAAQRLATQEIFSDLLRKLSYLNVVLALEQDKSAVPYLGVVEQPTYPTSPAFPKLRIFLAIGTLVGLILGAFHIMLRELERSARYLPEEAARLFGIPYFGELGRLGAGQNAPLLDAPQKYLTAPAG